MYYKHFKLSGSPFQFTPSPNVFYPSEPHREALAALEWGLLHEPSGLTLLVGEPGTGKTTLIASLLARHDGLVRTAYISNPKLTFDEVIKLIARQVGIDCGSGGRLEISDAFDRYLKGLKGSERLTVIIDEAQALEDSVLEELRLFSNSGPAEEPRLRFIFVGQPELVRRLMAPSLRQFNERFGARAILHPLSKREVAEYIDFRLHSQEGSARSIFTAGATKHIIVRSAGIPRRVNVLCHNAMLLAYSAKAKRVRLSDAQAAAAEYENLFEGRPFDGRRREPSDPRFGRVWKAVRTVVALAALAAAVLAAVYFMSASVSGNHESGEAKYPADQSASALARVFPPPHLTSRERGVDRALPYV